MTRTWLIITLAGIIPAAAIGYALGYEEPPAPQPVEVVEPEVVPEYPNLALGARPPGVWDWAELRGGECLAFFDDVWADQFEVVSCARDHQAEFVRAALVSTDSSEDYPGDEVIREAAEANCANWQRTDLIDGEDFDDLLVQPGYTLGEEAWSRGDRLMGCFVYQEDGDTFTSSLVSGSN